MWLLLSVGGMRASRGPLRPLCRPINATLAAENEACPVCITFTTSICAGYCPSMVSCPELTGTSSAGLSWSCHRSTRVDQSGPGPQKTGGRGWKSGLLPWVGAGELESELGMWEGEYRGSPGYLSLGFWGAGGDQGRAWPWADAHANLTPCPGLQVRVLPAPLPPVPQPVCTYRELSFASIRLPGCPPGVDPMVSFPVALSCRCGPCRLSSSDCGGPRAQPLACDHPALPDLLFL